MKAIALAILMGLILSGCSTPITECSPNGTRVVLVPDMQTGMFPMVEYCQQGQ